MNDSKITFDSWNRKDVGRRIEFPFFVFLTKRSIGSFFHKQIASENLIKFLDFRFFQYVYLVEPRYENLETEIRTTIRQFRHKIDLARIIDSTKEIRNMKK